METSQKVTNIINRLNKGMKFGMYNGGKDCYFEDGTKVEYKDLWDSLRVMHNLTGVHNKTLFELCPETYMGIIPYKFTKFIWHKKILALLTKAREHKKNVHVAE